MGVNSKETCEKLAELKKAAEEFETAIKNFVKNTSEDEAFIQVSIDSKGYVWIAKDKTEEFDSIIKDSVCLLKNDDGEKPIDKVIGQASYSDKNCIEYSYLSLYDYHLFDYTDYETYLREGISMLNEQNLFKAFLDADRVRKESL